VEVLYSKELHLKKGRGEREREGITTRGECRMWSEKCLLLQNRRKPLQYQLTC
jgi:hypothetical protein